MDYTRKPFYLKQEDLDWVERTFGAMTQEEKLNQVFLDMLWNEAPKEVTAQQTRYQLGGYRYNNAAPEKVLEQNVAIQNASKIPTLIAANVESGGTKIGEGIACAATGDPKSAYYMGYYGCLEAAAVGCNWTFAPVVDVDSKEAIHQTVLKLTGQSAFKGVSPVDAFCDRWDTRL